MKKTLIVAAILTGAVSCTSLQNEGVSSVGYQSVDENNELSSVESLSDKKFIAMEPSGAIIKQGEAFSIKLITAHICDFDEWSPAGFFRTSNDDTDLCPDSPDYFQRERSGTQGEVAIIANVGEQSSDTGLTLSTQELENQGRVIYYNEDIRESGHLLSFLNIPVYGPMLYKGKPFFMEWVITEIDSQENKKMQALLGQLAAVGAVAYPPAAPILPVLNSLGSSMLNANNDDTHMNFQMGFDVYDKGVETKVKRLSLREGYYVFVREEHRSRTTEWSSLTVNTEKGVVEKDNKTFRERTWLLVRIAREDKSRADGQEIGQQLGTFLKNLDSSTDTTKMTDDLDKLLKEYKALKNKTGE